MSKKGKIFREDYWKGRRDFLTRSAYIMAALGIAPAVRFDLTEKLARKMGIPTSTLMANGLAGANGDTKCLINIKLRSGYIPDPLFPEMNGADMRRYGMSGCDNPDSGNPDYNWTRLALTHTPEEQIQIAGANPGTNFYLSEWSKELQPLIESGKVNIAKTNAVEQRNGHTEMWGMSRGGSNTGDDIGVAFAALYGQAANVPGVRWNDRNSVIDANGNFPGLEQIGGNTNQSNYSDEFPVMVTNQARNFMDLFTPSVTPGLSPQDIIQVADVTKQGLNSTYVNNAGLANGESLLSSAENGTKALVVDLTEAFLQPLMGAGGAALREQFIMDVDRFTDINGDNRPYLTSPGEAAYFLTSAFANGAVKSGNICIETGDHHGYYNNSGGNINNPIEDRGLTRPAMFAKHFSAVIKAVYEYAEQFPNPYATDGSSLADAIVMLFQSEFTRGAIVGSCDNCRDGNRQGFILIGKDVKTGSYSNYDPDSGNVIGANRNSGQLDLTAPEITEAEAYMTWAQALGMKPEEIADQGIEAQAIAAMLKNE